MKPEGRTVMKSKIRKALCIAVAAVCVGAAGAGIAALQAPKASAAQPEDIIGTKKYVISNPYKNVDWDTWGQYKAATHIHSLISDGSYQFADQIENYYRLGFDAIAMTDHAAVNRGWTVDKTKNSERPIWFNYHLVDGAGLGGLTSNMKSLTEARNMEITTGVGRNGRGMIDIPMGIELNGASTKKCHVNGYFADAGQNDMEMDAKGIDGCVTAVTKNHNKGGLTHINHVGEFMEANDCDSAEQAMSQIYTQSWINEFAQRVFRSFNSCVGMELVNKSDNRTKWDRHLYDELLMRLAPEGRTLWGFCEDDSHKESELDQNCQWFILRNQTAGDVRAAMENGNFFCSSRRSKTELNDGTGNGNYPRIWRVDVDEMHNQITFNTTLAQKAVIVADGQEIDTVQTDPSGAVVTFDLNKYEDRINSYVRVYFTGEGGITYVQPFYLTSKMYDTTATVNFNVLLNGEEVDFPSIIIRNSLGIVVPMTSHKSIEITQPGDYTYEISAQNSAPSSGSFTITGDDFINGNTYTITVSIENEPELVFNPELNIHTNSSLKIITGLTVGEELSENVATASNSYGTVEIVPSRCGYGTGTVVNLLFNGSVIDSYTYILYGDTNGDAQVDATDAAKLKAYLSNNRYFVVDDDAMRAGDCNNDGVIDGEDVRILRRVGMGQTYNIPQIRNEQ